jgi:hypothetical protein
MLMLPHSFAIFRQQDFSCSVSWAFGIRHAIAGTPSNTRSTAAAIALANSFILVRVYPSEPRRAINPLSDEITKGTVESWSSGEIRSRHRLATIFTMMTG